MQKHYKLIILFCIIFAFLSHIAAAEDVVMIEYFYSEGCSDCARTTPIINSVEEEYGDQINITRLEVGILENWERWDNYGFIEVPAVVINYETKLPNDEINKSSLETAINNALAGIQSNGAEEEDPLIIDTPFGPFNISEFSLPVITIVLGVLDSFNPCSFFVLLFLLSLLTYVKSRRRMLIIGSIFIFFSGFIYFLFMLALFGIFQGIFILTEQGTILSIIAGILAVALGSLNIKDFFYFKKGPSLSIPEDKKPKLFKRMRDIVKARYLPSMIIGTVILAISVNAYELLCTVMLPMVFANILTLNNLSLSHSYFYILLYNLVYVIPLIIIVTLATIKLSKSKLTEWQGRVLKLFSGLMMFLLGLILLIEPRLLNNVFSTILLLITALASASVMAFIMKKYQKKTEV